MNKRGLSQVVAMILIILIVIVAVSIIWAVVRPTIERGVERVGTEYITIDMEIIGQSVFIDNDDVFFKVKRNPGKGNIIGLKVVLEDIDGKEKLFAVENFIIQELETMDVTISNYRAEGLLDISKISIAPVFSSDGREVIGNVVDVYVVSGLEGGGFPEQFGITLTLPQDGDIYNYNISIPLQFIVNDPDNNIDSCWYNINSGGNILIPNCQNTFFDTSEGVHDLTVFANNSEGDEVSDIVSFQVNLSAGDEMVGATEWQDEFGVRIVNANVNDSVRLFVQTTFQAGTEVTFDVWDDDTPFGPDDHIIPSPTALVQADGTAVALFNITDDIIDFVDDGLDCSNGLEFFFNASAGDSSNVSYQLTVSCEEGGGMNTTNCDFRLAIQREFTTPEQTAELAPYCIGTNGMSMGSSRILCRGGQIDTLEDFLNVTQEEVLNKVDNLNESILPRNTTAYLLLNCEGVAHPNTWRDWNNDTETQNAIFEAVRMRIDVFRGVFPNAIISLGPSPKGNNSERIEAFERAGEFGVFDKANCLEPRMFHRHGPDDGEFEDLLNLIENRARGTLDAASAIKNSTGDPIEFCVTSSILVLGLGSQNLGDPVIPEFAQHQVDVILEHDLVKLINWWSGDFYDLDHPELFRNMTLCDNQCQE